MQPNVCSWHPCQGSADHINVGLFLGSLFCSIGLYVCFYACTVLMSFALQYSLKPRSVMPLASLFFCRIALANQGLLWFHMNFRIFFSISVKKKDIGILKEIALSLDGFGYYGHFNNSPPVHEHGISFCLFLLQFLSSVCYSFQCTDFGLLH